MIDWIIDFFIACKHLPDDTIVWIVDLVADFGYFGIVIMMFLESSFFPFPSEVVMIPAGYLVSQGEMNIFVVIFTGILGSLLGALFNYYLAKYLGRRMLLAYGKWFFFTRHTLRKVDRYFARHGSISIFIGRLVPVVRQYISIPAGVSKMRLDLFTFYTSFGAGIWVVILTLLGYFVGKNEALIKEYSTNILIITSITIIALIYIYYKRHKKCSK